MTIPVIPTQGQPLPLAPGGPYTNPINGQPSSSPGSPGIGGALMDALAAIFKSGAPKSITQRRGIIDQAVQNAAGAPPAQAAPGGLGSELTQ